MAIQRNDDVGEGVEWMREGKSRNKRGVEVRGKVGFLYHGIVPGTEEGCEKEKSRALRKGKRE